MGIVFLIYSPQWVKHCLAVGPAAQDWLVLDRRQVGPLLEGREEARDGDHQPGGFKTAGGPQVPAEPHPVPVFVLLDEFLVGRHHRAWREKKRVGHTTGEAAGPIKEPDAVSVTPVVHAPACLCLT